MTNGIIINGQVFEVVDNPLDSDGMRSCDDCDLKELCEHPTRVTSEIPCGDWGVDFHLMGWRGMKKFKLNKELTDKLGVYEEV